MKWFVVYTKPNFEIKVARGIKSIGIKSYCPVYTQIKQYSDRKKKVEKPLLPSFVLVYLSEQDRPKVFSIPGVVRYLFWLGKPAEVSEQEIILLKKNLIGTYDDVTISQLTKGNKYTIPFGPFKGQSARVLDILKNKLRLVLPSLGFYITLRKA